MVPTLPPGTLVVGVRWRNIKPGQVVITRNDNKEKIKRIDDIRDREVYLLGDHLESSTDSRHFGWIDKTDVVAKIVWPRT